MYAVFTSSTANRMAEMRFVMRTWIYVLHYGMSGATLEDQPALPLASTFAGKLKLVLESADDRARDFVLDGECVSNVAFISFRPHVCVSRRVNELCGDSKPISLFSHAAF